MTWEYAWSWLKEKLDLWDADTPVWCNGDAKRSQGCTRSVFPHPTNPVSPWNSSRHAPDAIPKCGHAMPCWERCLGNFTDTRPALHKAAHRSLFRTTERASHGAGRRCQVSSPEGSCVTRDFCHPRECNDFASQGVNVALLPWGASAIHLCSKQKGCQHSRDGEEHRDELGTRISFPTQYSFTFSSICCCVSRLLNN